MLALYRKQEESVFIDLRTVDLENLPINERIVKLQVLKIEGDTEPKVRLGFTANRLIPIHREEVFDSVELRGRFSQPRDFATAAPKLLEACKLLLRDPGSADALDLAREAIAMAEQKSVTL